MKIDAQFESKNGKLYALKTGEKADTGALISFDSGVLSGVSSEIAETEAQKFSKDKGKILAVYVPLRAAEISENIYDEMYLAALRVFLKGVEACGAYAVVVPISNFALRAVCKRCAIRRGGSKTARPSSVLRSPMH